MLSFTFDLNFFKAGPILEIVQSKLQAKKSNTFEKFPVRFFNIVRQIPWMDYVNNLCMADMRKLSYHPHCGQQSAMNLTFCQENGSGGCTQVGTAVA